MSQDAVIDLARNMIWTIIITAAPMLIVSLVVGLIISIFQTVTSIQEQTLTFVPKLLSILLVIIIFGSWIMNTVANYMINLYKNFSVFIK